MTCTQMALSFLQRFYCVTSPTFSNKITDGIKTLTVGHMLHSAPNILTHGRYNQ